MRQRPILRVRSALAAWLTAAVVVPASASAAVRVAVIPFAPLAGDVPAGAGDKAAGIFKKALAHQSDFEVLAAAPAASNGAADALSQARQKVAEARAALGRHQAEPARAAYLAALAAYAQAVPELDTFEEVLEAQAELGATLYRMGRDAEAEAAMLEALRLSGGRRVKVIAGAPSYAQVAEGLRKRVALLGKGSVRVDSAPEGADVFVDGQAAGKTPVVLRDLPAGRHYLRAILPSGEKWGRTAEVAAKADLHVRAQSGAQGPAADLMGQLAENGLQPSALALLQKVAAAQQADLVVFGVLHAAPDGLALDVLFFDARQDARQGRAYRLKRAALDAELLEAGIQMDELVAELQQSLEKPGAPVTFPARVAPDVAAEHELASEFHFGSGIESALDSGPAGTLTSPQDSGDEGDESSGERRVVTKRPREKDSD